MSKYRRGTLEKVKKARGWEWQLRITAEDGSRPRYAIGLVAKLPSKSAAWKAAEPILKQLNGPSIVRETYGALIDLYIEKRMPKRHSTRRGYMSMINAHIRPKWGAVAIANVRPAPVEEWLLGLPCGSQRQNDILNVMRLIFKCGIHYEWVPYGGNPLTTCRIEGGTKTTKELGTLTHQNIHALLEVLAQPHRTMAIVALCLGLRVSELLALQWHDLDFLGGSIRICRAIVEGRLGEVKTNKSFRKLPLHRDLAAVFLEWRKETEFKEPEQFIFASPHQAGERPYNSSRLKEDYLTPAGYAIGLTFPLGWHTFRHTYRALLRKSGAAIDLQRDLMGHSDISITMRYGGTGLDELRPVNESVVEGLLGGKQ